MGRREADPDDLTVWAGEDGTVSVDVGSRFVAVALDELERILDWLADGGGIRLYGGRVAPTTVTSHRTARATLP